MYEISSICKTCYLYDQGLCSGAIADSDIFAITCGQTLQNLFAQPFIRCAINNGDPATARALETVNSERDQLQVYSTEDDLLLMAINDDLNNFLKKWYLAFYGLYTVSKTQSSPTFSSDEDGKAKQRTYAVQRVRDVIKSYNLESK
jgi:hypothetical protein